MLIEFKSSKKKYAVEIWSDDQSEPLVAEGFQEAYGEEFYVNINNWCIESLGYHARTAYNKFEFKKEKDLTLFIIKWG